MKRLMGWLVPKEERFFSMLKKQSENIVVGAKELKRLIYDFPKLSTKKKKDIVGHIADIENKGDDITHSLVKNLDKSFITPLDKEDIHRLSALLDDVIDLIDYISEIFISYNITKVDNYIKKLVDLLVKAVEEVDKGISNLKNLKGVGDFYVKVNTLEDKSDEVYNAAITSLFSNSKDPTEIIKYKDIYQFMENALDKCEDVAYTIESIVVKHA